jgi:putative ABC transport system permease protein
MNARSDGREIGFDFEHVDANYLPTLQIPLVQGRNFSPDYPADSEQSVIVNEAFVRTAGWNKPLGETLTSITGTRK